MIDTLTQTVLPNAPAVLGEAASLSQSGSLPTPSSGRTFLSTLADRLIAAGRSVSTFRVIVAVRAETLECWISDRRAAFLRAVTGEVTFSISDRRRGYLKGLYCGICRLEVHDEGEMCPKQWAGQCDVCGVVLLDYWGNCSRPRAKQRSHVIAPSSRHLATPTEWRRLRFSVVRGSK